MSEPVSGTILSVTRVSKRFEHVHAVRELTLEVPRGTVYGVIGPNGAGKTTTIRMILNIFAPDTGTIRFDFQRPTNPPTDRIGYLPEERGLYKRMTVGDVLVFMAEIKSLSPAIAKQKVEYWLERLGLSDWKGRKVQELSKGMQQKVQFISTILHEPELLILDELFSGLDPVNAELMKDIILELKSKGTTILFSTHVMEQAEKICDHLCMINRGQKVLDGPLVEVKSRFGADTLVIEGDFAATALRSIPGVDSVRSERHRHELTLKSGVDHQEIIARIVALGRIDSIQRQQPSLHGIFLTMVGDTGHMAPRLTDS